MTRSGADSCPTCRGYGRVLDPNPGDPLSGGDSKPCPDCQPASPPAKPRYRVSNSGFRVLDENNELVAFTENPTDAALIVKLLNENEERTK